MRRMFEKRPAGSATGSPGPGHITGPPMMSVVITARGPAASIFTRLGNRMRARSRGLDVSSLTPGSVKSPAPTVNGAPGASQPPDDIKLPSSAGTPAPDPLRPVSIHPTDQTPAPDPEITHPMPPQTLWQTALALLPTSYNHTLSLDSPSTSSSSTLLAALLHETTQKQLEIAANEWTYHNAYGERISYVDRFLTLLNCYAFIVDIAIQHDPHIIALVWAGFRFLLQVATAHRENVKTVFENISLLVRVLVRCEVIEALYISRGKTLQVGEQLRTSLLGLYVAVLKYVCSVRRQLSLSSAARIIKSVLSDAEGLFADVVRREKEVVRDADVAEKEVGRIEIDAQDARTQVLKALLVELQQPIEDLVRSVANLNRHVDSVQRSKVLLWLSNIPVNDHHNFLREDRHKDTGTWLLVHPKFQTWRATPSSILWLRGDAGCGKTMLASTIIDDFHREPHTPHHALAYFYCSYQERSRRDPASLLRALIKQLSVLGSVSDLPEPVLAIYKRREEQGHQSGALRMSECRDLIVELAMGFAQTTIVIDAVDECDRCTRRGLFSVLKDIVAAARGVRVFLTGRNDGDIQRVLDGFPSHYIDASDNAGDIERYIGAEIERCSREGLLLNGTLLLDGEGRRLLKLDIVEALRKGARGMFMWVHLQILAICRERTARGIRNALQTLPKGLDETYRRILQLIADNESPDTIRTVNTVLKWVLYAQELCSTAMMIEAISIADPDAAHTWSLPELLDMCQNSIVLDRELQILRFAHFSVQEFLVRQLEFDAETAHNEIAVLCLSVLLRGADADVPPLLRYYATLHWPAHVQLAGRGNRTLEGLWKRFLTPSEAYAEWGARIVKLDSTLREEKGDCVVAPLWIACHFNLADVFAVLLNNGAAVDCRNMQMQTPLIVAARYGYTVIVHQLIGCEVVGLNAKDFTGQTALSWAAAGGHEEVVQILLEQEGVDPDPRDDSEGQTPLSWAAGNGRDIVVEMLLAKDGVDPSSRDVNGWTPLVWAVKCGDEKVVRILLDNDGVDPDVCDNSGQTPLSWAARNGRARVVKILLAREGINPDSRDENGWTPLVWATLFNHESVAEMLLAEERVDPDSRDMHDQTPLSFAARHGREKLVQILLGKKGVEPDSRDTFGQTPLSLAAKYGQLKVVQALLDHGGVDPDSHDNGGRTPLSWAVKPAVSIILKHALDERISNTGCSYSDSSGLLDPW